MATRRRIALLAIAVIALTGLGTAPVVAAPGDIHGIVVENHTMHRLQPANPALSQLAWNVGPSNFDPATSVAFSFVETAGAGIPGWSLVLYNRSSTGPSATIAGSYPAQPGQVDCTPDPGLTCDVIIGSPTRIVLRDAATTTTTVSSAINPALWVSAVQLCFAGSLAVCFADSVSITRVTIGRTTFDLDRPVWQPLPAAELGKNYVAAVRSSISATLSTEISGLPAGPRWDTAQQYILGAPTGPAGAYDVVVGLRNAGGVLVTTTTLTLEVTPALAILPGQTLAPTNLGQPYRQWIRASWFGTWDVTGLPPGLTYRPASFDPRWLEISGATTAPGIYPVTVRISGATSSTFQTYTLMVGPFPRPWVLQPPSSWMW